MNDTKVPPVIFDAKLLALRRARAEKRGPSFLMQRCLEDAAERLMDINRDFENILILGTEDLEAKLRSRLHPEKIKAVTVCETLKALPSEGHFDLVISCLRLQSENDLPGIIIQLRQRLKADGLFIAAMFGGDTLSELRRVFYEVDETYLGGLAAHIYPLPNYTQAAELLTRAGFNQPVVDTDRFTVSYKAFDTLISDLRDLGETNVLVARHAGRFPKAYKLDLEKNYRRLFSKQNGKLTCSFEILWLTGWVPHKSQQKPLKPGSAKMSLEDALNNAARASGKE